MDRMPKMERAFTMIRLLSTSHWTVPDLAARLETSERTVYRYLLLLESVEFVLEKDFERGYFIVNADRDLLIPT